MQDLLKQYADHIIDKKTQKDLNEPLKDESGFNEGHEEFLKTLMKKVKDGEIDVHLPESLFNKAVYDNLPETEQEATSLSAVNIMSVIRQIEGVVKDIEHPTFQVQNLVETVFQMKSKFEEKHGDVFII